MENLEARALIRIIMNSMQPEGVMARVIEVMDERSFSDEEILGAFETGQAKATKEG